MENSVLKKIFPKKSMKTNIGKLNIRAHSFALCAHLVLGIHQTSPSCSERLCGKQNHHYCQRIGGGSTKECFIILSFFLFIIAVASAKRLWEKEVQEFRDLFVAIENSVRNEKFKFMT